MKRICLLAILILVISCNNSRNKLAEKKVLEIVKNSQGQIIRKVTTGYIPGEDLYLTIEEFDSTGNLIREYGAKPYGAKFKTEYKYDKRKRIINKRDFDYKMAEFENYKGGDFKLYSLTDTLADYKSNRVLEELSFRYDDDSNKLYKNITRLSIDSITGQDSYESFNYVEPINKK